MGKRLSERLATLEALEAATDDPYPPVESMDDTDVLAEVICALEWGLMYCWHNEQANKVWICHYWCLNPVALESWYSAMMKRVQPWIDAHLAEIEQLLQPTPPQFRNQRHIVAAVRAVLIGLLEGAIEQAL